MTLAIGGSTFAEDPSLEAPLARIIWHAEFDPATIFAVARSGDPSDPDSVLIERLAPWLDIARGDGATEHAVLSDGWHHLRLDIEGCPLARERAVVLRYRIEGLAGAQRQLLPLRRFLAFCRERRFRGALFRPDPRIARSLDVLRVHDGLASGASQREIAEVLFGHDRVAQDWNARSDWLRSRIRRLVREARAMATGGYRRLLRQDD